MISFQDAPSFEFVLKTRSSPSKAELEENPMFLEFLGLFLEKASAHFSKALELKVFLHRLTPVWGVSNGAAPPPLPNSHQYFKVAWIPAEVHMYPARYELHWMQAGSPAVMTSTNVGYDMYPGIEEEGIAEAAGTEDDNIFGTSSLPVVTAPAVAVATAAEEVDSATSIPLKDEQATSASASKERFKQRVRQARLRIALAQLRAERLAEKYYRRYGNFEDMGSDSDSDLSWGEEDTPAT